MRQPPPPSRPTRRWSRWRAGWTSPRRQVAYTRPTVPAAGAIANGLAEANEIASPGRPVVALPSGSAPEVGSAVAEALNRQIREGMPVAMAFDAIPDAQFDGAVTEVRVTTTPTGTTFPVTVPLGPDASETRSGLAAVVDIVFGDEDTRARSVVPAHAVVEEPSGRLPVRGRAGRRRLGYPAEPAGHGRRLRPERPRSTRGAR